MALITCSPYVSEVITNLDLGFYDNQFGPRVLCLEDYIAEIISSLVTATTTRQPPLG